MDFLLYWRTAAQIAFVLVVFGGGSVAGLYIVRRLVSVDHLQKNHEVAGVTFGVLGAFYQLAPGSNGAGEPLQARRRLF
jgi:hypothetical protein